MARRGPGRWLAVLALVGAGSLLGVWLGVRGLTAARHLTAARSLLTRAKVSLLAQDIGAARQSLARAGEQTRQARDVTGDPVWAAASHVPVLGASFAAARAVAVAADQVARQVLPPLVAVADQLQPARLRRPDGGIDLSAVASSTHAVTLAQTQVRDAGRRLSASPHAALPAPLARARDQLQGQLGQLEQSLASLTQALRLAPPLLGADRPRRYFVMIQQPGESRGTGGLTGGYAIVEAAAGHLRVREVGSDAQLRNGPIPVPAGISEFYVDSYAYNGAFRLWQNVNVSPNLPVVARVVAARWQAQGGAPVDGVVALDPIALADLLRGTAGIEDGYGHRIAPDQLVSYLTVGQYREYGIDLTVTRKQSLVAVGRVVAAQLTGRISVAAVRGLIDAVHSGHLRMASDDPALRADLRDAGVDGALPSGPAPVAFAVVNNASEGKLDTFLDRSVQYWGGSCAGSDRRSVITVTLRNDAPASGLPPYLTLRRGPAGQVHSTESAVLLTVYATRGAELRRGSLDGAVLPVLAPRDVPQLDPGLDEGLPSWQVYVSLPRLQPRTLVLELTEPVTRGRVRMPEQPLIRPLRRTVTGSTC